MAKKFDSGWRDQRLNLVHAAWDIPFPVAGMTFPTVEYDRGEAIAVVNYIRRDVAALPKGADVGQAYAAFSSLRGPLGTLLPFITVQYDPRNWAMQLFAHNEPAAELLGIDERQWLLCTELHFARTLYRLRAHHLPEHVSGSIDFSTAPWLRHDGALPVTGWPGQDMSVRRRNYEPTGNGVRFSDRNPCTDVDLAVVGRRSGQVALVVDYKLHSAYIQPDHKTHKAMAGLINGVGDQIPSMIVRYDPTGDRWRYEVYCLNGSAKHLLQAIMIDTNAVSPRWTADGWVLVDEARWEGLLSQVRTDH
jgi:hypothetical protein